MRVAALHEPVRLNALEHRRDEDLECDLLGTRSVLTEEVGRMLEEDRLEETLMLLRPA